MSAAPEAVIGNMLMNMNAASYSPDNNAPARAIQGSLPEGKYAIPPVMAEYMDRITPITIRKDVSTSRRDQDITDVFGRMGKALRDPMNLGANYTSNVDHQAAMADLGYTPNCSGGCSYN